MQLEARSISFGYHKKELVLKDFSLSVGNEERLGLVARSGFGKSTLAKILAGYETPFSGEILIDGKTIAKKGYHPIQLIYQHTERSINPLWKMKRVLEESDSNQMGELMDSLGIKEEWLKRYPRELSGGELQRFAIARALGQGTKFIIADEISTMLDGIAQAQIWHFLLEECGRRGIGLILVTHNRYLAQRVSTRILDMEEL